MDLLELTMSPGKRGNKLPPLPQLTVAWWKSLVESPKFSISLLWPSEELSGKIHFSCEDLMLVQLAHRFTAGGLNTVLA